LCKEPSELVLVTTNHMDGIKEMFGVGRADVISKKIDYALTLVSVFKWGK
jgi:hypothetical protein